MIGVTTMPKGPGLNPVLATFIRVILGVIGVAFYSALFLFIVLIVSFFYGANMIVANIEGYRNSQNERKKDTWHNRATWMWVDGFKATVKFIFTGGNKAVFMTFWKSVSKPLITISGQYWDQETRRL
jgi:hypothetical protein